MEKRSNQQHPAAGTHRGNSKMLSQLKETIKRWDKKRKELFTSSLNAVCTCRVCAFCYFCCLLDCLLILFAMFFFSRICIFLALCAVLLSCVYVFYSFVSVSSRYRRDESLQINQLDKNKSASRC